MYYPEANVLVPRAVDPRLEDPGFKSNGGDGGPLAASPYPLVGIPDKSHTALVAANYTEELPRVPASRRAGSASGRPDSPSRRPPPTRRNDRATLAAPCPTRSRTSRARTRAMLIGIGERPDEGPAAVEGDGAIGADHPKPEHRLADGLAEHGQRQPHIEKSPHAKTIAYQGPVSEMVTEPSGEEIDQEFDHGHDQREPGCHHQGVEHEGQETGHRPGVTPGLDRDPGLRLARAPLA